MKYTIAILSLIISSQAYAQAPLGLPPGMPGDNMAAPAQNPSTVPANALPTGAVPAENATATSTEQTPPSNDSKIQAALAQLTPESAALFETAMRKNLEKTKAKQQEVRSIYVNIRSNFVGPAFNKELFLQESARARELQSEIRMSLDQDLAEVASKLPQAERQLIFNALPSRYTKDGSPTK